MSEPSRHVDVNVKTAEDLTGNSKIDAGIKIVKYLGVPTAVAGFGLYIIHGLVGDYRDTNKSNALATTATSAAVVKQSDDMEDIKLAQESQKQAMWKLREGQMEQLEIQRAVRDGIQKLVELQSAKK